MDESGKSRRVETREFWEEALRLWAESGLSVREFCNREGLPDLVQIHFCMQPTDMRKGFDSLAALVRDHLGYDPLSGHLFVFRSRRGDRVKMLCWDRDGFTLYYRRLEEGTFRFPAATDANVRSVEVSSQELSLLLWGIDPSSVKRQKRCRRRADDAKKIFRNCRGIIFRAAVSIGAWTPTAHSRSIPPRCPTM